MGFLRLFLAVSVVVWHMPGRNITFVDARVAVLLFFIVSGFYMAMVIAENYGRTGEPGWRRRFWSARFLRIFPAYLAMCAVMVAWFGYTHSPNVFTGNVGQPPLGHAALITLNLGIVGQDMFETFVDTVRYGENNPVWHAIRPLFPTGFFDDRWMLVGQAWSLATELLFYALAPFVVRSVRRLLALLVMSLTIRWGMIFLLHGFSSEVWGYHFFPATLCLFVLGSLAYHLYAQIRVWPTAPKIGTLLTVTLAILAGVSLWRYGVILLPTGTLYALDTPGLWLAYIGIALCLPFLFARWQRSRIDRWIGELSYPLYIVHGLTVGIVFFIWRLPQGHIRSESVALALSLLAAAVMYGLVDLPFDRWRHRRYRRPSARDEARLLAPESTTARLVP